MDRGGLVLFLILLILLVHPLLLLPLLLMLPLLPALLVLRLVIHRRGLRCGIHDPTAQGFRIVVILGHFEELHEARRCACPLDALVRDFIGFGGTIVIRKFDTPRDLVSLSESVVVNCTGLGARDLFGDRELVPLKGQLTVLVPQPEIEYGTFGGLPGAPRGEIGIHMQPRSDGIALGGTSERGVWSTEPNEEARQRVVEAHMAVFSAMRGD